MAQMEYMFMDINKLSKKHLEEKTNEVKKAFEEMTDAYKKCEDFEKTVVIPKNFILDEEEKLEEKNLVEQLKECIKSWEGKLEDLRSFNLD